MWNYDGSNFESLFFAYEAHSFPLLNVIPNDTNN